MTSTGPYHQKTNLTFMFDKNDLRGPLPKKTDCLNSLSYILSATPEFSKFRYILRLSKLDDLYNDQQANFTLFVPTNDSIPESMLVNMDLLTARNIITASTLNYRITSDILSDSPCAYFTTNNAANRMFVSNFAGQTTINNYINLIGKDISATNGIIHVIDKMLLPIII
jgi:uncharacterized surface protein with fasciclin (FAS1) repeats